MNENCSSDQLGQKLQQMAALFQIAQRTLDSSEGSIYMDDVVKMMGVCAQLAGDCELLRQRIDAELYQQNSKYYERLNA